MFIHLFTTNIQVLIIIQSIYIKTIKLFWKPINIYKNPAVWFWEKIQKDEPITMLPLELCIYSIYLSSCAVLDQGTDSNLSSKGYNI